LVGWSHSLLSIHHRHLIIFSIIIVIHHHHLIIFSIIVILTSHHHRCV